MEHERAAERASATEKYVRGRGKGRVPGQYDGTALDSGCISTASEGPVSEYTGSKNRHYDPAQNSVI